MLRLDKCSWLSSVDPGSCEGSSLGHSSSKWMEGESSRILPTRSRFTSDLSRNQAVTGQTQRSDTRKMSVEWAACRPQFLVDLTVTCNPPLAGMIWGWYRLLERYEALPNCWELRDHIQRPKERSISQEEGRFNSWRKAWSSIRRDFSWP